MEVLSRLYTTIQNRKNQTDTAENSYTAYLFEQGLDKILKKVGEESSEVIIAAKNGDKAELILEISDLAYHLLVLMNQTEVSLVDVQEELEKRAEKIGNKKPPRN